jgi:hypothetical protein
MAERQVYKVVYHEYQVHEHLVLADSWEDAHNFVAQKMIGLPREETPIKGFVRKLTFDTPTREISQFSCYPIIYKDVPAAITALERMLADCED